MKILGIEIKRNVPEPPKISFTPKIKDDGAVITPGGGVYGIHVDIDGAVRTETELVNKYREMSQHPEMEQAIDDIINEVIVGDSEEEPIKLVLDDLKQPDRIKKLINDEFTNILELLEFQEISYEIFKRWYVDGRLYYHTIIDNDNPREGIKELRYIDPRKIRKVREQVKKQTPAGVPVYSDGQEYYVYSEKGFSKQPGSITTTSSNQGVKIAKDSIVFTTSGLMNSNNDTVLSHLHKAIKPLNQLRMMEDSLVIYRISRAPERRIFYIDVGDLPKSAAEQYLSTMQTKFKNKVVYNAETGEIRDRRMHMHMLEDFWLPRRSDGKGTEITTLPGGENLGQIDDVIYFQRKLYKSLNVPITRLDPETVYNLGRSTEITRDEMKFMKFVDRLRKRFSQLFTKLLERQLILKGIVTLEEWPAFAHAIRYEYSRDIMQVELKEQEIMRERINLLRDLDDYTGPGPNGYFSRKWVQTHILRQTEDEIAQIEKEKQKEAEAGDYVDPETAFDPPEEGAPPPDPADAEPPPGKKPVRK